MKNLLLSFLEHTVLTVVCFLAIPVAFYAAGCLPAALVEEHPVLVLFVLWAVIVAVLFGLYMGVVRLIGRAAK